MMTAMMFSNFSALRIWVKAKKRRPKSWSMLLLLAVPFRRADAYSYRVSHRRVKDGFFSRIAVDIAVKHNYSTFAVTVVAPLLATTAVWPLHFLPVRKLVGGGVLQGVASDPDVLVGAPSRDYCIYKPRCIELKLQPRLVVLLFVVTLPARILRLKARSPHLAIATKVCMTKMDRRCSDASVENARVTATPHKILTSEDELPKLMQQSILIQYPTVLYAHIRFVGLCSPQHI